MKITTLLILFMNSLTYASDGIGLGANVGSQSNAFTVGDYNLFDWDQNFFGYYRYGGGGARLQLGQGVGISMSSTGGIAAYTFDYAVIGVEPFDGTIVANSNRSVESQYTYTPGISLLGKLGPIMLGPKIGLYGGNLGGQGMNPDVSLACGAQALLQLGSFNMEGTYTKILSGVSIGSGDLIFKKVILRYENYQGLREETNYLLLLKVNN